MIVEVFSSSKKSFFLALKELKDQVDERFDSYDFLIFSIHPKYGYQDIPYLIEKVFQANHYAGFHAVNAFENENIIEGVVLIAMKFEKDGKANLFYVEDIEKEDALERTSHYLNTFNDKLHVVVGGLCKEKFGLFIEKLSEKLEYHPVKNIIGGLSSGYKVGNKVLTYQFVNNIVIKNGFFILTFDNIDYDIGVALGFKPYGITYEIKKADGYKLYTVDDNKNFSYIAQNFLKDFDNFDIRYLWYTPINILDEEDGYVATLRTFKEIGKDYVEFFGQVKEGQHFKLSFATSEELLEEDFKIAKKVKDIINNPDFAINFSCIARQYVLEDKQDKELEIYTSVLNCPLFGFFTFGEIGPDKHYKKLKLYNETSLLLAVREK
ncbi:MAG: FIST C-terminal domain-containing protein [Hydrogenobaculum sp.]